MMMLKRMAAGIAVLLVVLPLSLGAMAWYLNTFEGPMTRECCAGSE